MDSLYRTYPKLPAPVAPSKVTQIAIGKAIGAVTLLQAEAPQDVINKSNLRVEQVRKVLAVR